MKKLTADQVEFTISVEQEDIPVRGNYMATDDPEQDKRDEDELLERIERGDDSAWCCLIVEARWRDFVGRDSLGACTLEGGSGRQVEAQAWAMADDHGMREQALADLNEEIRASLDSARETMEALDYP